MDENLNNISENKQQNTDKIIPRQDQENAHSDKAFRSLTMDENGKVSYSKDGAAALAKSTRTLIILGWISAALTAFVSPFFAIAGIAFGIFANRREKGSGNVIVVTNVVLASVNILFGLFLMVAIRKALFGY